ncbi:MAG: hypothetical protein ACRESK_04220 [Gammaproteobacteria bacterium]
MLITRFQTRWRLCWKARENCWNVFLIKSRQRQSAQPRLWWNPPGLSNRVFDEHGSGYGAEDERALHGN